MEGVDINLDVNIGKQLSALGHTLTMLTSVQEDETINPSYDSDEADTVDNADASQVGFCFSVKHMTNFTLSWIFYESTILNSVLQWQSFHISSVSRT